MENGDQNIAETPGVQEGDTGITEPTEDGLDEDAQIQAEEGGLVDGDDDLVHDLGGKYPLRN